MEKPQHHQIAWVEKAMTTLDDSLDNLDSQASQRCKAKGHIEVHCVRTQAEARCHPVNSMAQRIDALERSIEELQRVC